LAVSDEFLVARCALPRRHIGRHAPCPTRPMIGNVSGEPILRRCAGARREQQAGAKHDRYGGNAASPGHAASHLACCFPGPGRHVLRPPFAVSSDRRWVR
jgi:hypothetical protein